MHPALWQLLWFDFRGSMRGLLNVRKSWRQVVLLVLMLAFAGMFISFRAMNPGDVGAGRFGAAMPFWAFIYLLATWLTASADRGLVMRPAEIHFIVGGPFRDRDVITVNLIRLAFRALVGALVLALIALAYVESYLAALTGIWLLISVSLLVGMIASLTARSAQANVVKQLRRVFTILAVVALMLIISQSIQAIRATGESLHVSSIASSALKTPIGQYILPPLNWMFAPVSANRFAPDALIQLPARLGVIGLLVCCIYVLGRRYAEATTGRTDQSISKRQTSLRSGVAGGAGSSLTRSLRLPMLWRLGGVGPVAWMQMTHSLRILPRYVVFTATIVGVVLVIPIMVDSERLQGIGVIGWMAGLSLYADFLLLLQLPVGFLGPVAQREMLKSLPIPSWRIVLGQLAGPLIPLVILHGLVAGLFLYLTPRQYGQVCLVAFALLPAALVIVANINLLGAWNIIRPKALQQRDALAAGRAMASVWVFFAMLTPAILVSTLFSGIVGYLTGNRIEGYILGASGGALLSSSLYIFLLASAFKRWQPSGHEGGQEEAESDS